MLFIFANFFARIPLLIVLGRLCLEHNKHALAADCIENLKGGVKVMLSKTSTECPFGEHHDPGLFASQFSIVEMCVSTDYPNPFLLYSSRRSTDVRLLT